MNRPQHVPVLLEEVLEYLNVRPGGVICDATLGLAGHSSEIAKRLGGRGRLIGFDRDPEAMEAAKVRLEEVRAEQVVNQEDENELADLIYEFGEERRSRRIARAIVRARPITTTAELAQIVSAAAPSMKGDKIHPATRTFQALRIRVNNELGEIQSLLKSAGSLLKPGGRLVLISFHSLEDRLVKDAFREAGRAKEFEVLTKKPVVADEQEQMRNPRSRSAKMRAAEKQGIGSRE